MASYDEDSVSMAVEASREAIRGAAGPDQLLFATTSPPYAEKLAAAILHAGCALPPETASADLGCSSRAGLSALALAAGLAASGRRVLVCASDVVIGAPEGARERSGGDAAAAFVMGPDAEAGARVIGHAALTTEYLDVWRTAEMPFARQWEERFGFEMLAPLLREVATRALRVAGLQPADLSTLITDATSERAAAGLHMALGVKPEPFAEARGRVATYTVDRLAYSLQPPVVAAVVDFEQGGRFQCELTDVDPGKVAIGDEVEMTFRRLFTAQGVHNYFWKARPLR